MNLPPDAAPPRRKPSLFGILTFVGNVLTLSICLLGLWVGVATAAPGSAAVLAARERLACDDTPVSVRAILADTRVFFRPLWIFGPAVILSAGLIWVALAFWLVFPAPFGIFMIVVTMTLAICIGLIAMAVPSAARPGMSSRHVLRSATLLVTTSPWRSILALMAAAAVVVLSVQFPAVGLVAAGGAMTEIAFRTWRRPPSRIT